MLRNSRAIVIAGPTACGKSELALALARQVGGAVINADSLQLYAGLPLLTAQPDARQLEAAPHRLYGALPPDQPCNAAAWVAMAQAAVAEAGQAGLVPIIVGGTGLYIEALLNGIAVVPEIPPALRAGAEAELARLGHAAFHARLAEIDPQSGQRIHHRNTHRLVRAWSVWAATGRTLTAWQADPTQGGLDAQVVVSLPPRDMLRQACDRRFLAMLEAGAVEEVRVFRSRQADSAPAARALGFRQIAAWLDGGLDEAGMIEQAQAATRQYAKRQVTWFGNRLARREGAHVFPHQLTSGDVAALTRD